jgi:biopolymer transport protein ExbD
MEYPESRRMLRSWRKPQTLFSDFNTLQFACVMCIVLLVPLTLFMTYTPPHHGVSADLPEVTHAVSMPGALREDAMKITITRDGRAWFGTDPIYLGEDLSAKIRRRLEDHMIERKVYITADMRAHWGSVSLFWMKCVRPAF